MLKLYSELTEIKSCIDFYILYKTKHFISFIQSFYNLICIENQILNRTASTDFNRNIIWKLADKLNEYEVSFSCAREIRWENQHAIFHTQAHQFTMSLMLSNSAKPQKRMKLFDVHSENRKVAEWLNNLN